MTTRRAFIKAGALALFGIGSIPSFLARAASEANKKGKHQSKRILVCIFQRGAMDGLMAVTPFEDPFLKEARPNLFMTAVKGGKDTPLIDLDGKFGLHPSMNSLEGLFKRKSLAIVHGIGSPNNTRSHFDAQDYMESGTPFVKGTSSGWLNRAISFLNQPNNPFQAVSLTSSTPRIFYGDNPTLAINSLKDLTIQSRGNNIITAKSFEDLYDETTSELLKETGKESFEAVKMLGKVDVKNYRPSNGVVYSNTSLGNSLKQIAQLIKMDVGLEIAFAESGGWDTHYNQGTNGGVFARNIKDFSDSITSFWNDLEVYQDNVTVMTMTEFGRTVKENGTRGTDHGRASCNFILGNNVNGGKVFGEIEPLSPDNLEDGRDLKVTTDFRSVFNEVVTKHFNIKSNPSLFPGWSGKEIGVIK